jgi:hypothetical protein
MASFRQRALAGLLLLFVAPGWTWAGMPSPRLVLTELGKMRLQSISFFLVGFLAAAGIIQLLWNYLRKDFTSLPRLTYVKAVVLVGLWGLLFVLVLTMISGARELMTPGAWEKQGTTYRLTKTDTPPEPVSLEQTRQRRLERLWTALWDYARTHDGRFPPSQSIPELPKELWRTPDPSGMPYVYRGGSLNFQRPTPLAFEPELFGADRFVLFTDGDVKHLTGTEFAKLLSTEK